MAALPSWDRKVAPEPHWQRQGGGRTRPPRGRQRAEGPEGWSPWWEPRRACFSMCGFRWELGSVCQLRGGLGAQRGAQQKPAPVHFLRGEGRGPHPDREVAGVGASRLALDPCWTCPPPAGGAGGTPPPAAFPALGRMPGTLAKAHFGAKFWVHLGAYGGRVHAVVLSRRTQEGLFLQAPRERLAQTGPQPASQGSPLALCEMPRPGPPRRAGTLGLGGASGKRNPTRLYFPGTGLLTLQGPRPELCAVPFGRLGVNRRLHHAGHYISNTVTHTHTPQAQKRKKILFSRC